MEPEVRVIHRLQGVIMLWILYINQIRWELMPNSNIKYYTSINENNFTKNMHN